MSSVARPAYEPRIVSVEVSDEAIVATFTDGRIVSMPLRWSYRLEAATPAERRNYWISGKGYGVHWPDLDEDLSAHGFFTGTPAPRGTVAHRRFVQERKAAETGQRALKSRKARSRAPG